MKLRKGKIFSLWLTDPKTNKVYWCGPKKVLADAFLNNPHADGGRWTIKVKDLRPGGVVQMWDYECVKRGARELTDMEIALWVGKNDV